MFWMNFSGGSKGQGEGAGDEEVSVSGEAEEILGKVMPYGVSLLLHVGLLLMIAFATVSMALDPVDGEAVIIPVPKLSKFPGTEKVIVTSPTESTVNTPLVTERVREQKLTSTNDPKNFAKDSAGGPGTGGENGTESGRGNTGNSIFGVGGVTGRTGGEGREVMFEGSRGESEFKSGLFGNEGGNAVRIVYLIDASGTLIETLPFVVTELKRSIAALSEKQQFAVIFFQGSDPKEVQPPGMKDGTAANKTRVFNWIDSGRIIPQGGNNPVKAIQAAMAYKPHLIYILSDNITGSGIYQVDQRSFVDDVVKASQGRTKICTIQFITQDPLVGYGMEPTLMRISKKTGGVYKYLDAKELGIE